ncbi:S41 family peptidase [Spirosoma aerophilum]
MRHVLLGLLFLFIAGHNPVQAQAALTSMEAYNYLQGERQKADKIVGEGAKPSPDSLAKAEKVLLDALVYYHRPDIVELAKTNKYLFARKGDISFDLGLIQARMGKTAEAAKSLSYPLAGNSAPLYAKYILDEPAFAAVRSTPEVARLLTKAKVADQIFNSSALKTPYQPNIGEDEKVAGLSKLWSEAKYNFAYFDHIPDVDWDKLYLDYLPKIRATRSTVEYYRTLKEFCAQLHDGHTDVGISDPALADSVARRPPIWGVLIEDKVMVQDVTSDSLYQTGIRPGLEIMTVDGMPVKDYADRFVRPYQSGSTVQNVDVQTYIYNLLRGAKNKPVTVGFRSPDGKTFSRTLPRTGYSKLKALPDFSFRLLPGNVAYVQLNSFDNSKALDGFKAAFDSIATSNALILDIRQNGGGDSGYGWNVLGYLTDKPMKTGSYSARLYSPLRRARGEGVVFEPVQTDDSGWPANGKKLYTKPVVVLTSGQTFSAAEDFAVVFDAMKRGTIIGEPTGGSTGQPLFFALPGGVTARVCTKRDMYPDGTEWNAKGIQPQVLVKPTVADWKAGRDTVLEAALAHLGVSGTAVKSKKGKGAAR